MEGMKDPKIGIGGAPTRATTLPNGAGERKKFPIASGVLDYFPDALVAVAEVSYLGNVQHNPGQPLHWARSKSGDEADTMMRHFVERGTRDTDNVRHSAKMAWRALALLQKEIEDERKPTDDDDKPVPASDDTDSLHIEVRYIAGQKRPIASWRVGSGDRFPSSTELLREGADAQTGSEPVPLPPLTKSLRLGS